MRISTSIAVLALLFMCTPICKAGTDPKTPASKAPASEANNDECGADKEPLKLQNFKITLKHDRLVLDWMTAYENNSHYFELQRSLDGEVFDSVDVIHAKGTSSQQVDYKYYLYSLEADVEYYRLKMVLYNDTYEYSQVVKVVKKKNKKGKVRVHPVPFKDKFNISYKSEEEQGVEIKLYNESGQLVFVRHELADEGRNRFSSPELSSLQEGKYNLVLETNNSNSYQKILKVK